MENEISQNLHGDPFISTTDVYISIINFALQYFNCLNEAATYILSKLNIDKIDISIVEGSGLLDISNHLLVDPVIISLYDVPHSPIPTAIGHK